MSNDLHEVYAVCYATHARRRSENYIFGDPHDEMTSIAYYVWVIKGRTALSYATPALTKSPPGNAHAQSFIRSVKVCRHSVCSRTRSIT